MRAHGFTNKIISHLKDSLQHPVSVFELKPMYMYLLNVRHIWPYMYTYGTVEPEPQISSSSDYAALMSVHSINEFRCYEVKIEESEKAGSRRESNPGHLWLEPPVLCH